MAGADATGWHQNIFDVLCEQDVNLIVHVPDVGHGSLITKCKTHEAFDVVTVTTEEEDIGVLTGAWVGAQNRENVALRARVKLGIVVSRTGNKSCGSCDRCR